MTGRSRKRERRGAGARLYVYSDGAARGNPGPAGIGGIARDEEGTVMLEVSEYLGNATNNVAEYYALIRILEECAGSGNECITVCTDSE
jgi:ribonuclease HI